jgi:hypothetical protein
LIAVFKWATNGEKVVPDPLETSEVRIFTATWNMQGRAPSLQDLKNLLHADTIHHDIYVVGS